MRRAGVARVGAVNRRARNVEVNAKKVNKAVLAYSGGLDTSIILKWLKDAYDCEVVTFTADLGQVRWAPPAAVLWAPSATAFAAADVAIYHCPSDNWWASQLKGCSD